MAPLAPLTPPPVDLTPGGVITRRGGSTPFEVHLDVFSGPGMAEHAAPYSVSRKAADILIAAGLGQGSPAKDWLTLGTVVLVALSASFAAFVWSARSRT